MVRKEVKWKMIAGIDKSELVLLKFSKSEIASKLKWKHSKEFEFNSQMYDIVDKVISKDSIQYWCWWDYKETKLNKQLDELLVGVFQHDSKSKEKQDLLFKFYKSVYFQPVFSWSPFKQNDITKISYGYNNRYQSLFVFSEVPPPNFLL